MPQVSGAAIRLERGSGPEPLPAPYLLFLGDTVDPGYAKTAFGLRDWAPEQCVGQLRCHEGVVSLGLPELLPAEARARGARSLLIGVANKGGFIAESWIAPLVEALNAGLDIVSGLHARLGDVPALAYAATRNGRRLIDIRTPPEAIPIGTGLKRSGKRILTVGTDCALGKKYTALAITRALHARGRDATFRATGQTGIMIAGQGIPMDAVVSDFLAGAAEMLSPAADPDHIDVIEGQGSLFHPGFAAVTLGLLHGSQPDLFVVCHQPGRGALLGYPDHPTPDIAAVIEQTVVAGRLTSPAIRCAGISLNTGHLETGEAEAVIEKVGARHDLPCADPMRGGAQFDALLDACLA